jgi:hypothetical protein
MTASIGIEYQKSFGFSAGIKIGNSWNFFGRGRIDSYGFKARIKKRRKEKPAAGLFPPE